MKATGERCDRCLWQKKGAERVAAIGERGSRTAGKESTGHRNRDRPSGGRPRAYCDSQGDSENPQDS